MNRRKLLSAAPVAVAAALVAGDVAKATELVLSSDEQIARHAQALIDLIRQKVPADADDVTVTVKARADGSSIDACAMKTVWKDDDCLKNGGLWIKHSLGNWALGVGRY